ncbi:preprotein translocase subunit SecE [Candidatus Saccharibacteria bacterium]|nr:preprotein translocase subunit SecE [Candidatus Saccharibacteria bacterium]
MSKTKITRIKASDPQKPKETSQTSSGKPSEKTTRKSSEKKSEKPLVNASSKDSPSKKDLQLVKETNKKLERLEKKKQRKEARKNRKTFILFRPFIALGRYIKNSWLELRQVRWPNRKATWKMVLAIFVYTILFTGFLVLLDILFDFIFSKLLG